MGGSAAAPPAAQAAALPTPRCRLRGRPKVWQMRGGRWRGIFAGMGWLILTSPVRRRWPVVVEPGGSRQDPDPPRASSASPLADLAARGPFSWREQRCGGGPPSTGFAFPCSEFAAGKRWCCQARRPCRHGGVRVVLGPVAAAGDHYGADPVLWRRIRLPGGWFFSELWLPSFAAHSLVAMLTRCRSEWWQHSTSLPWGQLASLIDLHQHLGLLVAVVLLGLFGWRAVLGLGILE